MRSGLKLGIAAIALTLSLAGCDQIKQMTGQSAGNTATTANTVAPTVTAPGAIPSKPATGSNPALEAEMTAAAAQLSGSLPMQVDAITRVVAVRAEGTEFVYEMQVSQAVPAAQVETIRETLQRNNQTNICRDANVSAFIRRGGSMNHRYTDASGNRFETRVVSCP